jgi:hypothetical protein
LCNTVVVLFPYNLSLALYNGSDGQRRQIFTGLPLEEWSQENRRTFCEINYHMTAHGGQLYVTLDTEGTIYTYDLSNMALVDTHRYGSYVTTLTYDPVRKALGVMNSTQNIQFYASS